YALQLRPPSGYRKHRCGSASTPAACHRAFPVAVAAKMVKLKRRRELSTAGEHSNYCLTSNWACWIRLITRIIKLYISRSRTIRFESCHF
ncbi:hypothetical protein TorRG33x02_311640, partial [Trema orientale]